MHYQFIDRVVDVDVSGAGTIATRKTFPRTEDYFTGTFRRSDEVPASLVLEAMAAAGALLLVVQSRYRANAVLLKVTQATFPRAVQAGDQLTVRASLTARQGEWPGMAGLKDSPGAVAMAETAARGFVGETPVAEADILYLCVPMAWTLGQGGESTLVHYLDLMGIADSRP